jgi:hypothetical protein
MIATISSSGSVTGLSTGTTTITYTNSSGCQITTNFTVNALPVITGSLNGCSGFTSLLSAIGSPAAANPWVSSNPLIATITSFGLVTGVSAGTTTITYTTSDGCQTRMIITVNLSPAPTGANNQTVSQGSTLANLLVTGQNIVWYSTPFEGTPLTLNTPLVNGTTYYASQTINGCESQDRLPVTVQFTLNNNEFDSINIVYNPNPVIDILYIKASTELKNAKICNVLGQTIFQQRFNSNEIQLNMSDFSTGTYFVIVESDERKETFKILKK